MRRGLIVGVLVWFSACARDAMPPTAPGAPTSIQAFAVAGTVADTAARLLPQARVEAIDGPQRGAVAMTDNAGRYSFPAIFTSPFSLRAIKDGYRADTRTVAAVDFVRFFRLESLNGSIDLTGDFEVAFAADAACVGLPASVRTRSYLATFAPSGSSFYLATLRGGDFGRSTGGYVWDVLYVNVFENFAHVFFSDPPVWDHLSAEAYVVVSGEAEGVVGPGASQWPFSGTIEYCPEREPDDYPECEVPPVTCRSSNHQLTLTRR